jgi:hypothetical protein
MNDYGMVTEPKSEWILQSAGTEYGPYSLQELSLILCSNKLPGEKFVWKHGLKNWLRADSHDDLMKKLPGALDQSQEIVIERGNNIRKDVRSTLIATVAIWTPKGKFIGICFDLSPNGLQARELRPILQESEIYEILIIPLVASGVKPFSAKARVAWMHPERMVAGFEFHDEVDKISVVNYLKTRQKGYG